MLTMIFAVNLAIFFLFMIFYSYQIYYLYVGWKDKKKEQPEYTPKKHHHIGVLIAARNESAVIGELIKSIKAQTYPEDKWHLFVVADNCTDNTAEIVRRAGGTVFERNDLTKIGKGYALNLAFKNILGDPTWEDIEAFLVLDADNLLEPNYFEEMNKVFDSGYRALTSYRNSKNFAQNWITSGYGLWFVREAEFLNRPRMVLGNSCAISGTGFMIARTLIEERDGWNYHTLTEDIEFSAATVISGEAIGYAAKAELYDEQPVTFKQSWDQRLRWAKGFYQVLGKYGGSLMGRLTKTGEHSNRFSCYDMMMTITPALFVTLGCLLFNVVMLIYSASMPDSLLRVDMMRTTMQAIGMSLFLYYTTLFIVGALTTYTEWDHIIASKNMKIKAMFTFPLFMFTYIPIAIAALLKKVEWKPIKHTVVKSIEDMKKE